jgi:polyhydroxyalkanoate synthesis regulator phasin
MPPAKRATSSSPKSNSSAKPAAKRATGSRATKAAASSGAKATATSAGKASGRAATQAKSAATKTRSAAASGAAKTRRSARSGGADSAAKSAGAAAVSTARAARSGAKGTGTAAKRGAANTRSTAKAAATSTKRASGGDGVASVYEQLVKGSTKPQDLVMLTRDRIRETLDDAASRGRVTRKDADELVSELMRRGRSQSEEFRSEIESLLGRVETATKRAAGVGPSFPIIDYDNLNVGQIQSRLKDLGKPDLRKVLTYERKNANRKTVVGAIEKALS